MWKCESRGFMDNSIQTKISVWFGCFVCFVTDVIEENFPDESSIHTVDRRHRVCVSVVWNLRMVNEHSFDNTAGTAIAFWWTVFHVAAHVIRNGFRPKPNHFLIMIQIIHRGWIETSKSGCKWLECVGRSGGAHTDRIDDQRTEWSWMVSCDADQNGTAQHQMLQNGIQNIKFSNGVLNVVLSCNRGELVRSKSAKAIERANAEQVT